MAWVRFLVLVVTDWLGSGEEATARAAPSHRCQPRPSESAISFELALFLGMNFSTSKHP